MKYLLILMSYISFGGCSPSWSDGPYEVYWIDGQKSIGYSLGDGAYIGRIDEPKEIQANQKYISVYACPEDLCGFYYIDKVNDHKFAEATEFVFGPYTKNKFAELQRTMSLPILNVEVEEDSISNRP